MNLLLVLIAHFLGDFVFQTERMAQKKRTSIKSFVLHCLIYSFFITLTLIWIRPIDKIIFAIIIIVLSHVTIDFIKNILLRIISKRYEDHRGLDFAVFVIDQIIHITIILFIVGLTETRSMYTGIKDIQPVMVIAFIYFICLSPAAVFIKKVLALFSLQNEDESDNVLSKSGYLIGVLERIIILTLGLSGQLGAIGFVLAAKSLARFKQLEDKVFAEKYLIGTLLSTTIALLCVILGKFLLD